MAKTKGPLFSIAAHGTLGKCITFITKGKKTHARFQRKQKDYMNEARYLQRIKFKTASVLWRNLTQEQKDLLASMLRG